MLSQYIGSRRYWLNKPPTVSSMHDIVEIVDSQTSIFIGLACNSTQEVVTFTARLVSTSSGKEVRYMFCQFHALCLSRFDHLPLFKSRKNPAGLPQRNKFLVSNSNISPWMPVVEKSKSGMLVG